MSFLHTHADVRLSSHKMLRCIERGKIHVRNQATKINTKKPAHCTSKDRKKPTGVLTDIVFVSVATNILPSRR